MCKYMYVYWTSETNGCLSKDTEQRKANGEQISKLSIKKLEDRTKSNEDKWIPEIGELV